jgi:ornithine carbamoyltransferase
MQRRTELLNKNDKLGLVELEKECLANNARYKSWECDERKMKPTKKGNALYMHCLPADISDVSCVQGEVSKSVFDKYRLATYAEAGFKPFVIAAIIYLTRIEKPVQLLTKLVNSKSRRNHG